MSGSDDDRQVSNPWVKAGVFGALGFEFIGFTLVGVFVGQWLDARYEMAPWGLLGMLTLAIVAAGAHIITITRRFLREEED